jgi:SAM-dependent methyltransferase
VIARFTCGRPAATLLDFGCGNMPYRSLFELRVARYVGCDLPGNELADCHIESIARLPHETSTVSIVLSTQTLEHVEDPAAYLKEAQRVLEPGGHLILTTHGLWRYHPDPVDLWRWTSAGLQKQLRDAGFEIVYFEGLLGPGATALQLWQDAARPGIPHRLKPMFTRLCQHAIEWADRRCPAEDRRRDACVYTIVGEKRG